MIKIYPGADKRDEVIDVFDSLKGQIEAIADCIDCAVMVDEFDESAVCYMERWQSQAAFDQHIRSESYACILEVLEQSTIPPTVAFYKMTEFGGLDHIGMLRSPEGIDDIAE